MLARIFDNPQNLNLLTIQERLTTLDPTSRSEIISAIVNVSPSNPTGTVIQYVSIYSNLNDLQIINSLSSPITTQEGFDLTDYSSAKSSFANLPNWATWSSLDASNYINQNILNGMTQAQVDAYINSNAINISGINTVLHQIGTALINIRTILSYMAQAIIFIRNLVIRFGR